MKSIKKITFLITALILMACTLLTACPKNAKPNEPDNKPGVSEPANIDSVVVIVKNGDTQQNVDLDISGMPDNATIYDLFVSESVKNIIQAEIEGANTDMAFLTGIYGITPNADNYEYIAIYTDISSLTDNISQTVTVNDVVFYYANVGIKGLTLKKDAHYLFNIECWTTQEEIDLQNAKDAAKIKLDGYKNAADYRDAQKSELAAAVAAGKEAIDAAGDIDSVNSALAAAKSQIDGIKTDAVIVSTELANAKTAAKAALDGYKNAADYRDAQKSELAAAVAAGKTAIDAAGDIDSVNSALAGAKSKIDGIRTDADITSAEKDLQNTKVAAKIELDGYKNVADYRDAQKSELAAAVAAGKTAIDAAGDINSVNAALAEAKSQIDAIKTDSRLNEELNTAKSAAKTELENYKKAEDYREEQKTELAAAIADGKKNIDAASNEDSVKEALTAAKTVINGIKTEKDLQLGELEYAKENAKSEIESYKDVNNYRAFEKQALRSIIDEAKKGIDSALDIASVNEALTAAKARADQLKTGDEYDVEELASVKASAKKELEDYKNPDDYRYTQKSELSYEIEKGKATIDRAENKAGVRIALNAAKAKIDVIKTDAQLEREEKNSAVTIRSTLENGKTYLSNVLTADVWATDINGLKVACSLSLNGANVPYNWDDSEKTSFTLTLIPGKNEIVVSSVKNGVISSESYTVYYEKGAVSFTISVDAFTIGCGYLVEPTLITLDDEYLQDLTDFVNSTLGESFTKEEFQEEYLNAACVLLYVLTENGYEWQNTGSIYSGFYLSYINNFEHYDNVPDNLRETLENNGFDVGTPWKNDELGEFDYTWGSGWMYCVNGVFPNVGFSDWYIQDGDVMRVQFTLAYGADIGGTESLGGGMGGDYFENTKKQRDDLTKAMAQAIADGKDGTAEYQNAFEVIQQFNISAEQLEAATAELLNTLK